MSEYVLEGYRHLTWRELQQKANPAKGFLRPVPVPEYLRPNGIVIARECFRPLRDYLGRPVRVNSAFRGDEYNEAIGGARRSQHRLMRALDLSVEDFTGLELRQIFLDLRKRGKARFGGLGIYTRYPDMVHVDTRRLWGWVTTWPKDPNQDLAV